MLTITSLYYLILKPMYFESILSMKKVIKFGLKPRQATEYKEIELDYDTMEYIEDIFYSLMEEYEINLDKLTY